MLRNQPVRALCIGQRAAHPSSEPPWTEPDSYVYVFDSQCGRRLLNGRWEVTVENGSPLTTTHSTTRVAFPAIEMPTLADLMHQVERARADGDAIVNAFEADPEDGHPTRIDIDWLPNAVDDEECYPSRPSRLRTDASTSPGLRVCPPGSLRQG